MQASVWILRRGPQVLIYFTYDCDMRDRYITGFLGPRFWHLALEKMVGQVLTWISDGGLDPRCMQRMCLERGKVEESRVHKDI